MPAHRRPEPSGDAVGRDAISVRVHRIGDGVVIVELAGPLDLQTGPVLQDCLADLLAGYPEKLIIDLSGVSVLGTPGLAVLMRAKRTASQQDTTLVLGGTDRRAVAVPMRTTGLDRLFEKLPSS